MENKKEENIKEMLEKWQKESPESLVVAITMMYYFGTCFCGKNPSFFNYSRDHWFYCDGCQVRWWGGSNLFSRWRTENERIWKANARKYRKYRIIEPACWNLAHYQNGTKKYE